MYQEQDILLDIFVSFIGTNNNFGKIVNPQPLFFMLVHLLVKAPDKKLLDLGFGLWTFLYPLFTWTHLYPWRLHTSKACISEVVPAMGWVLFAIECQMIYLKDELCASTRT